LTGSEIGLAGACLAVYLKTLSEYYTVSQKNVQPLACYNFDAREWILMFFGRNVTEKEATKRRLTMPPQITCASALPVKMGKHENHIFHSIGLCYTHNAPVRCLPERKLECGPMPNVMVAPPNIGGALCSTPRSLADADY